ncbi:MAG: DMT family transporter [Patescibacteria group bacterium]
MNPLFPVIAAVLEAASLTLDKFILSMHRMHYQAYIGAGFPLFLCALLALFFIIRPPLTDDMFTGKLLLLLALAVCVALGTNLLYYRALKNDHLNEMQTVDLLFGIPAVLYAKLIFPDEKGVLILLLALVASAAVVWSHWEHHHFRVARRTLPYLLWIVTLAPFSAIATKELLAVWHPVALLLVTYGIATVLLTPYLFRHIRQVPGKAWPFMALTSFLTAISITLYYFSYQNFGVIYTMLIFALQPFLVYFAAFFFLKEQMHRKKIIAFFIILSAIIVAQFA